MKYKQYYNRSLLRQFDNGHCQALTAKLKWKDGDERLQSKWRIQMQDMRDDGDLLTAQEAVEFIPQAYKITPEKAKELLLQK